MIIRHDIDTSIYRARDFFDIEYHYGCVGTYYFRLSMLDVELMKEIERNGGEASYHYEELATFAKQKHLYNKDEVMSHLLEIQNIFYNNIIALRHRLSLPFGSVASHGDFVNVKLKIPNYRFLTDDLRKKSSIFVEAYDDILVSNASYISDVTYGANGWSIEYLTNEIDKKTPVIYFLSHPRAWGACWYGNTVANIIRIYEGLLY